MSTSFALVLHELGPNAVKYGAFLLATGRVKIEWSLEGDSLKFNWKEEGVNIDPKPSRKGSGTTLIQRVLSSATVKHEITASGVECSIILPFSEVER